MTYEERIKRIKEAAGKMRLMDDVFMAEVFSDRPDETGLLLRVILEKDDIQVLEAKTHSALTNTAGHSVGLDILASDSAGRIYDIEVQRRQDSALPKRARYYSSMIDKNSLDKGAEYCDLPESYVIFINEKDVLNRGRDVYRIERTVQDLWLPFGDGTHVVYVNGENRSDTPLGKLMHDFCVTDPDDMYYTELAERTRYLKQNREGLNNMSSVWDDLLNEFKQDAREEGLKEGREEGVKLGREEGHAEGRAEGRREGMAEGRKEGRAEGRLEERREILEVLGISYEEYEQKRNEYIMREEAADLSAYGRSRSVTDTEAADRDAK